MCMQRAGPNDMVATLSSVTEWRTFAKHTHEHLTFTGGKCGCLYIDLYTCRLMNNLTQQI